MHVWHVFAGRVPESSLAMLEVGDFARNRLDLQLTARSDLGSSASMRLRIEGKPHL